jgi:two-component system response regulator
MITTDEAKPKKPVRILMIEDDQAYILLMKKHLEDFIFPIELFVAYDGEEALMVLRNSMCFPFNRNPDFILLDLGLPRVSGQEVLVKIKENPNFRHIPVLILTNSKVETDFNISIANDASAYLNKPGTFEEFKLFVRGIEEFWLKSNI